MYSGMSTEHPSSWCIIMSRAYASSLSSLFWSLTVVLSAIFTVPLSLLLPIMDIRNKQNAMKRIRIGSLFLVNSFLVMSFVVVRLSLQ